MVERVLFRSYQALEHLRTVGLEKNSAGEWVGRDYGRIVACVVENIWKKYLGPIGSALPFWGKYSFLIYCGWWYLCIGKMFLLCVKTLPTYMVCLGSFCSKALLIRLICVGVLRGSFIETSIYLYILSIFM